MLSSLSGLEVLGTASDYLQSNWNQSVLVTSWLVLLICREAEEDKVFKDLEPETLELTSALYRMLIQFDKMTLPLRVKKRTDFVEPSLPSLKCSNWLIPPCCSWRSPLWFPSILISGENTLVYFLFTFSSSEQCGGCSTGFWVGLISLCFQN